MKWLLLLFVLFAGCVSSPEMPEEVPEDFHLIYSTGATHLEWGAYWLEIDSSGNAEFVKGKGHTNVTETFDVSQEDLLDLYSSVVINDFFGLNGEYSDPSIMDGGYSYLSVTAKGKTKKVMIVNTENGRFSRIEEEVTQLIDKNGLKWTLPEPIEG